jgi:hypothetical protein
MEMYDTVTDLQPQVIVGEQEAGAAAKARNQLNKLIKGLSGSTFDVMDLAYDIKSNGYFKPKYNTFAEYGKTLDLKLSKLYYLVKIREVMNAAGVSRETYEPIGLSKLRAISRLDPNVQYEGYDSTAEVVGNLIEQAAETSLEEIKSEVAKIQGLTGDDSFIWLNVKLKHSAREVVRKAITVAKKEIGSVSKDDEGISKDASDGAALEVIALDFLSGHPYDGEEAKDETPLPTS